MKRLLVGILWVTILYSCYEEQEGCLDVLASNYDVKADNPCKDCCRYPSLILAIAHLYKGESFTAEDTLTNDLDQQFKLLDFSYIVSDIAVETPDGDVHVLDSIRLEDETYIYDDIVLVTPDLFTQDAGNIRYEGEITGVRLSYGLPKINDTKVVSSNHLLNQTTDSLYQEDAYVIHRLLVAAGNEFSDTLLLEVKNTAGFHPFNITPDAPIFALRGRSLQLTLESEYFQWFRDVNFEASKSEIESKIFDNSTTFIF